MRHSSCRGNTVAMPTETAARREVLVSSRSLSRRTHSTYWYRLLRLTVTGKSKHHMNNVSALLFCVCLFICFRGRVSSKCSSQGRNTKNKNQWRPRNATLCSSTQAQCETSSNDLHGHLHTTQLHTVYHSTSSAGTSLEANSFDILSQQVFMYMYCTHFFSFPWCIEVHVLYLTAVW